MCNCNSSFCAVCCRRVKAYRFDNVPEITGDLQLYTEFYKVGEAYGHWKFTIDDLEAYLDIPTVLWQDKLVAFGHTATGGLFYDTRFIFDYSTLSFTIGNSINTGQYSASIGESNLLTGDFSLIVGQNNANSGANAALFGQGHISSGVNAFSIGGTNIIDADYCTTIGYNLNTAGNLGSVMISDSIGGVSSTRPDSFTARFEGGYRFMSDSSTVAVSIKSSSGEVFINNVANNNTEDQLLVWNVSTKEVEYRDVSSLPGGGGGTVTSVGMTITGSTALAVSGSPITTSGTFAVTWTGNNTQYVAGDGSLITFPTLTSGTVTAVNSGAGMDFANFTTSGTIILGAGSDITLASTNSVSGTTHAHKLDLGGSAGQYLAGDNTLQTFPTIIDPTGKYVALSDADAAYSGSFTDANSHTKNSELYGGGATNTPLSGYGFLKTHGAAGGAFSWQEYKEVYDGDNRFFRGNVSSTWIGSTWYQYASRQWVTAQGYTTNTGTVTAVNSGAGMDFTNFTTSGTIILGTPSSITLSSTNAAIGTTHSHALNLGGTSGQYLAGDNTLQTFPTIPTVTPSALTRTNDTNILLNLTGSNTTALLQAVDIEVAWSGLLSYTRGGTGLGSLGTANQILRVNAWATALEYFTPTWTSNTGTVTNFSANDLTTFTDPLFTVNVTNPTTIPDLTFTLPTLTQKLVFAAPWGVSGQPFWRQLLPSDLSRDGASTGQVIAWNGTAWVPSAASGGVTSVSAGNGMNFTTITTTGAVTMGTPSSITLSSTNGFPSATTHTHAFTPGGSATTQYVTGLGTLATNLWTDFGTFLQPTGGNNIRTNSAAGLGWIHMLVGDATHTGRLEWYNHLSARVGFIGYYEDRFCYFADSTYHSFEQTPVRIQSIATDNTLTNLLVVNGTTNEIKKRTIASLTGLTTDVFKIQGGTTNASAITDDIYHNGKLKLGTSTSSAYQLSVSGTGYFTSTVDFNNNVGIQGFTTGAVIKNLVKLNSSNQEEIGVSGTDIILPAYTSARSADTKVSTDKYMYVNASGLVKLDSDENIRNIIGWISKTTNTGVTAGGGPTKISGSTVQQTAGGPYTTVSGNLTIPAQDRYHLITVTVQFVTTSGVAATPNITFDVYNGSGVVQDSAYIVNHDVINDTKEYSFVLQGTTAGVTSIYVRATATVAGITVQKCHMKAMDMGPV